MPDRSFDATHKSYPSRQLTQHPICLIQPYKHQVEQLHKSGVQSTLGFIFQVFGINLALSLPQAFPLRHLSERHASPSRRSLARWPPIHADEATFHLLCFVRQIYVSFTLREPDHTSHVFCQADPLSFTYLATRTLSISLYQKGS